jgi:Tol biopolymer transport system component
MSLPSFALALACGALLACESTTVAPPGSGVLEIGAALVGTDLDPDGFTVAIDTAPPVRISNGNAISQELRPGLHQVSVSDVAANCAVDGAAVFQINVLSGSTTRTSISLVCNALVPPPTNLWVYASTVGQLDPDGFLVSVDNGVPKPVGAALAAAFPGILPGLHSLALSGFAPNCTIPTPSVTVDAVAGMTTQFVFKVKCHYPIPAAMVFTSTRAPGGYPQLYFRSAAGAQEIQLLPAIYALLPVVSPAGDQVAYVLFAGSYNLRVVNLDGTNDHSAFSPDNGDRPAWSPDGLRLALNDNGGHVWVVNADGTNPVNLTTQFLRWRSPSWSPDGSRIVISIGDRLNTVNPDGTGQTDISQHPPQQVVEDYPVWSPDGAHIAYLTAQIGVWTFSLHVMASDGSGDITIYTGVVPESGISWAPDGSGLTFCGTTGRIGVVNADGGSLQFFGSNRGLDCNPRWSPDGSAIGFTSTRDGNSEIYVMNPDGTGVRNATLSPAEETMFSWVP